MNKKLVLIVGAGASCELGLPSGNTLKDQIARLLNIGFESDIFGQSKGGDPIILNALRRHAANNPINIDISPYLFAAISIKNAIPLAISIDNYLDAHKSSKEIEICGKLAIARAILDAERKSIIYNDKIRTRELIDLTKTNESWLNPFFRVLTENCQIENLEERLKKVAIITFNYDRCIEHFLHNALQIYYRISDQDAAHILKSLEIHHPYGTIGSLPWSNTNTGISYGSEIGHLEILEAAMKIKTFTEGREKDSETLKRIKILTKESEKIAFLGFAYHRINMDLLSPEMESTTKSMKRSIYATTFGISENDSKIISSEIRNLFKIHESKINLQNSSCKELFEQNSRGLSLIYS